MKPIVSPSQRGFSLVELLFVIAIISLLAALLFPVFGRVREQARSMVCFGNMRQIGSAVHLYIQDWDESYPMNRLPDESHAPLGCIVPAGSSNPMSNLEESRLNWRRVVQPYIHNKQVLVCPSNPNTQLVIIGGIPSGDQTNRYYLPKDYLPLSYAYNGNFFHEAIPPCLYDEPRERPRYLAEIDRDSNLIFLVESRLPYPDIGNWFIPVSTGPNGSGAFQSHNAQCNFLFADLHVKRLKLAATCAGKMWTDRYPDYPDACQNLDQLALEYR